MTSGLGSLLTELDGTLYKASEQKHLTLLRQVTDLFLNGAEAFSDEHVAVFDDVLGRLIVDADATALAELSNRLAPLPKAPVNVVSTLASHDHFAVATPLLRRSNALSEAALVEIAKAKTHRHLLAIADRKELGVALTDILIDRGNADIWSKLAANPDAQFSEFGYAKLINRARGNRPLIETIGARNDLLPELVPFVKVALEGG